MELQRRNPEEAHPSMEKTSRQRLPTESAGLSSSSRKKSKKYLPCAIRRSERIQNAVLPYRNRDTETVVEEITVSESEQEDEPPAHSRKKSHEPALDQNLMGRIDYVVQLLQTQETTIKALKLKDDENPLMSESLSPPELRYKSLYIESHKKIQALMEENRQLAQKLETALGKVEAYEKGTRDFSEVLDKLKDVILISNLTKVTETAVNASSQAIWEAMIPDAVRTAKPSAGKRRKITKES